MNQRAVKDSLIAHPNHGQIFSEKATAYIAKLDAALNKRVGWEQNNLHWYVSTLIQSGSVEVGWRECCGKTDMTMHINRAWKKVIAILKKEGLQLKEERVKHGNRYATTHGGFWNSVVYSLAPPNGGAGQ